MSKVRYVRIADESFDAVLDEVVKQAGERFDQAGSSLAINALIVFKNSIQHLIENEFGYLPASDRETIDELAAFCVNIGILFASSPDALAEVLRLTKAKGFIMNNETLRENTNDNG